MRVVYPSLPSISDPPRPRVVVPIRIPSMGQIDVYKFVLEIPDVI